MNLNNSFLSEHVYITADLANHWQALFVNISIFADPFWADNNSASSKKKGGIMCATAR